MPYKAREVKEVIYPRKAGLLGNFTCILKINYVYICMLEKLDKLPSRIQECLRLARQA